MPDFFLQALQAVKDYNNFDLNQAFICVTLSSQAYNTQSQQVSFLSGYGFTNITILTNKNAHATLACYGDDLYIGIMGTDFSNINDILDNADIIWTNDGIGKCHAGYQDHLSLLWNDIEKYVKTTKHSRVIVAGHSMGGACGQLINYKLQDSIGYYFGSTRVINKLLEKTNKSLVYHIHQKYDIIPNFPPVLLGFEIFGEIFVILDTIISKKQPKWYDMLYSIFYTIAYFVMLLCSKLFHITDHLSDLILNSHQIDHYYSALEAIISLQAMQQ